MIKITLKVDGMACGMCEAHMNDTVRKSFNIKKVTSSHAKKETVIITENDIEDEKLYSSINATGYRLISISREPYEKFNLFNMFKKP